MAIPSGRFGLVVFICGFLTVVAGAPILADDGLEQLRTEARTSGSIDPPAKPAPPQNANPPNRDANGYETNYADDDDDCMDLELAGALVFGTVFVASSPFWLPAKMIGDDYSSPAFFPRYPYQRPVEGHLMIEPYVPRKPREWSGRFQVEYGGDFADMTAWNGALLLETTSRFGIDSSAHYFAQQLPTGATDHLWLGDTNLLFRFAQSPNLEMRTGVGFNWLADNAGSDFGFNFTYGGDWYPIRPLIVSSELDWGEIGHASLFHARVTAGVQWHRAEVYAGYEYLDVGNAQFDNWIAGCRFWF